MNNCINNVNMCTKMKLKKMVLKFDYDICVYVYSKMNVYN